MKTSYLVLLIHLIFVSIHGLEEEKENCNKLKALTYSTDNNQVCTEPVSLSITRGTMCAILLE